MADTLELARPDDWHLHVRDGTALHAVVPHSARQFGRAIIMPNLDPPVVSTSMALAYRERVLEAVPLGQHFTPLMTLYLTEDTPPDEIERVAASEHVVAVKLYPAGATTHSQAGVRKLESVTDTLEAMAARGVPLLVHGESTDPRVDIFDRERVFIERELTPLLERIPDLRVVLEHITTREAVRFVTAAGANVGATITPQHLLMNRNHLFRGGIRPHHYCLPVLKRESHREALLEAATSDNTRFFLGSDSAPHPRRSKESGCGCAGIYSAHAALALYAEAFEQAGALERLEPFASFHGPDFYGLPRNKDRVTLIRKRWQVPAEYGLGDGDTVVPLRAGEYVGWMFSG